MNDPSSPVRAFLALPIAFPEGLAPGKGRTGNRMELAKDGAGRYLLRGSSLAGVLRHAYQRFHGKQDAECLFGVACDASRKEAGGNPSPLAIPDCILNLPAGTSASLRQHNAIDRRRGAVMDGRLFSIDALPPDTTTTVVLWLEDHSAEKVGQAIQRLAALTQSGFTIGAAHARGIGRLSLAGDATAKIYHLNQPPELASWLIDHREWRSTGKVPSGKPVDKAPVTTMGLQVTVHLTIPRGQDLLVSADRDGRPQRVMKADGWYWRLPGSTLRGLFRDWTIRLARRGEPKLPDDAVASLFGFVEDAKSWNDLKDACRGKEHPRIAAGRLHITDGFAPCECVSEKARTDSDIRTYEVQDRKHVAVDQISGGASDSRMFDNQVLVNPAFPSCQLTTFEVQITILEQRNTKEQLIAKHEVVWLGRFLTALHLGVIRVGSSKASGWLAITNALALGDQADELRLLCQAFSWKDKT